MALHFLPVKDSRPLEEMLERLRPKPGQRASRTKFDALRTEMARAWMEELPYLTREERWQDMTDTHYLLDQLSDLLDEGGQP